MYCTSLLADVYRQIKLSRNTLCCAWFHISSFTLQTRNSGRLRLIAYLLADSQVCAVFSTRVIRKNVPRRLIELSVYGNAMFVPSGEVLIRLPEINENI